MSKPRLVVDFDDVCVDFMDGWLEFYAKRWLQPRIAYEDTWTFELDELLGVPEEEKNERMMAYWHSPDHDQIRVWQDAPVALDVLAERYELHMATARPEVVIPQTMRLVDRYFPEVFTDWHFAGSYHHAEGKRRTKGEICDELEAVGLIDDSFKNCVGAVSPWRKIIMPDRPWNRKHDHPQVIRTFGWSQILSTV